MNSSIGGGVSVLLALASIGCARAEPITRSQVDVLRSRSETTLPAPAGFAIELTEQGNKDGAVAGRVHQVFNCQKTTYQDVRRTDYEGTQVKNGWAQVGLAGLVAAPGVYLIARAPSYSKADPGEGKLSSSDTAYFYGTALTVVGAALLGHAGYLWVKSGESGSSKLETQTNTEPAIECQRAPAAGVKVALVASAELGSVTTDDAGTFRLDLNQLAAELPITQAAPELRLAAGQQAQAFRPTDWWSSHVASRREVLLKRLAAEQRACDDGTAAACASLAATYLNGQDQLNVAKDIDKAKVLFQKACQGGSADGCFEVGLIHFHGTPPNEAEAARAFRRACDQKHPGGCNNLGVMYEHGSGGLVASLETARQLFERACAGKDPKACDNVERTRINQAQRARAAAREAEAAQFRRNLQVGSDSHCGLVVEVKGPVAKVQAMVGEVWLKVAQLHPKGAENCRFVNNVYVDP